MCVEHSLWRKFWNELKQMYTNANLKHFFHSLGIARNRMHRKYDCISLTNLSLIAKVYIMCVF